MLDYRYLNLHMKTIKSENKLHMKYNIAVLAQCKDMQKINK